MYVLILPSWYFPLGSQEISGRMFHHLAACLRGNGIDARILYSNYGTKGPFIKREEQVVEEGVPTWRYSQFYPPKWNKQLLSWWKKKCVSDILFYIEKEGKPDLIHAHSYFAASVCSELQSKNSIPFIYTERLSSFLLNRVPELHQDLLENVFADASNVTCVSPGLKTCLEKYSKTKIEVVPNFYTRNIFSLDSGTEKYLPFTWVSIGEPAHIKGLDILLHAFAELKTRIHDRPMQLILIDRIPEKKELIKLAKSLHIEKEILWKDLISQEAIAEILNKSHVLVSASRVETFGKSIIEAQACGLPVVASKTDGAQYILRNSTQGELFEIGSMESLVQAMEKVGKNYADYHPQEISKQTEERFSSDVVIELWISLYKSLLT